MDLEFIKVTATWNKTKENTIKEVLEKYQDKNILIFKKRRKLNKWYEKEFDKKIEI